MNYFYSGTKVNEKGVKHIARALQTIASLQDLDLTFEK